MDFVRKGMQHAAARFAHWKGIAEGAERERFGGIMEDGVMLKNGELHPDARLIEAAPELLEALQAVIAAAHPHPVEHKGMWAAWEKARAAIAKALGQNTQSQATEPAPDGSNKH